MQNSRRSTATALASLGFAALLLTACSASGGAEAPAAASDQSTAQACTLLKNGVTGTMNDLQSGLGEMATDPEAAVAAVQKLTAAFSTTAKTIDNTEVRAVADEATDALTDFGERIAEFGSDPAGVDQEAVVAASTDVQDAMTKLGSTCP